MEELLYLPPQAEAPTIDYGIAIGIPPRVSGRGDHCAKLFGPLNLRRSSRPCPSVFLHMIDSPDASCWFDSNGPDRKHDDGRPRRVMRAFNQRVKRQPLFAPAADPPFNLATSLGRNSASDRGLFCFLQCAESQANQGAPFTLTS